MKRFRIKIAGQSGAGLLSTGEIITKALMHAGFNVVADREYPSLIKGGHSCFVLNISRDDVWALSKTVDVMLAIDKQSMIPYFPDLKDGGILVHGYERLTGITDILEEAAERKIEIVHLMARETAIEAGGNVLMQNVVLVGMLWKALGLDYKYVEAAVKEKFASKPKILELDLKCLKAGFDGVSEIMQLEVPSVKHKKVLLDGNKAIAMGAVHGGCRTFYAYPMSPASSILTWLAKWVDKTKMVVKQAEDEITAAQMTIGSMYMGTRAMTATSGGGFDLMTESVSLAGIIENPLVVVIAQRPGPGTGLPTWTMQGDLNLAIYSAHGEFARIVIAVSDPQDCFELIQHAFNLAEEYQVPVIVLTEKVIAESHWSVDKFETGKIAIKRGLVEGKDLESLESSDRYKITEDGVSKRWIPGSSETYYFANGDEHEEDGSLTEEAEPSAAMYAKRVRKMETIEKALPKPEVFGEASATISFVGWGSSKNVMKDIVAIHAEKGVKVNYLHYSFIYPFDQKSLIKFFEANQNVHLIENNYMGQFGNLAEAESGKKFAGRLLKYDGRPFFIEDVNEYINKNS